MMKKRMALALAGVLALAGCGQPAQQEPHYDRLPMVMVEGALYYDTGRDSQEARCGVMDGEITSAVEGWETPSRDDQSNFGSGYGYQYGAEGTIEVNLDGAWRVFAQGSGEGNIRFQDQWYDKGCLSEETLEWLTWYHGLTPEEQQEVRDIPAELTAEEGDAAQTDPWGIVLTAEDVTSKGLNLICTQTGDSPAGGLLTGQPYHLEQKTEAGWETLSRGDVVWTMEGWPIPREDTVEWRVNWTGFYGKLPVGDYRIGKTILLVRAPGDYDEKTYYAEFTVE